MPRSLQMYLADVQISIEAIEEFTRDKSQQDFEREKILRSAVRGELILIGEAIGQMLHHFPETGTRVASARKIVDFRNLLIHEYGDVDEAILWSIVIQSLPKLKAEVQDWIDNSPPIALDA
jgi:uncharacterized protein with HEPN domain